ncbi:MAG: carboxymuconolactone decarboxylase family protein [Actinophytocola sp.]|uniref:carboxymuconolactone decarboxylase family protein n=1 Tax=Actinophytocola sp. TaxID=1872138 RepID=UPI003C775055
MTGPRVSPGTRRQLGWFGWVFTRLAGLRTRTAPPALFTVLGRHRRLFRRWLIFASALMPGGRLPRRDTELVILRVATLRASAYELAQHVAIGRSAGLSRDEIDRVQDLDGEWHGRDRVLVAATDALVRDRDLDDDGWRTLRTELSEVECLEFCLLVTHYDLLATVIGTLRIPPDEPR